MTAIVARKMYAGLGRFMVPVPKVVAATGLRRSVSGARRHAALLSADERRVHHFAVEEMAVADEPLELDVIAERLDLSPARTADIVDKLERMKTFVYRNNSDGINWAYPLSLEDTGHELTASTGERFFSA